MCEFPSWRECKDGTTLFVTDEDIEKYKADYYLPWTESFGHRAISLIYPTKNGRDREGFADCPEPFLKAIKDGRCDKMMRWADSLVFGEECNIKGLRLPKEILGSLVLEGQNQLYLDFPKFVGNSLYLHDCMLKDKLLPEIINGNFQLSSCKLEATTMPKRIGHHLSFYHMNVAGFKFPAETETHVGDEITFKECEVAGLKLPQRSTQINLIFDKCTMAGKDLRFFSPSYNEEKWENYDGNDFIVIPPNYCVLYTGFS